MIPTLLITLREVVEASLIVATILGILIKLNQKESIKTVWTAAFSALAVSFLLVFGGATVGINIQKLYAGPSEPLIEGILFAVSAFFVTWAVFVLHKHFARKKMHMLQQVKKTIARHENRGIFFLAFTAVLREGIEIVLFLSTMYLTSNPVSILSGFAGGLILGLLISLLFFFGTVRLPVYWTFRATSLLLILFAGGLLARGVHEFAEIGVLPQLSQVTFTFLPATTTFAGDLVKAMFGVTQHMDMLQLSVYLTYIFLMHRWVFVRSR